MATYSIYTSLKRVRNETKRKKEGRTGRSFWIESESTSNLRKKEGGKNIALSRKRKRKKRRFSCNRPPVFADWKKKEGKRNGQNGLEKRGKGKKLFCYKAWFFANAHKKEKKKNKKRDVQ